MPSLFPGMDPFIEGQKWKGFHHSIIIEIRNALMPQVRPRYTVDVEEDVYLAREDGTPIRLVIPDVSVTKETDWSADHGSSLLVAAKPTIVTLPMTEPLEVPYLVIRSRDGAEMVAVIEVLSPTNKSPRDGRAEYLTKRNSILRTMTHLIELDLLRGGERLPTVEPHPAGDYFTFVSRTEHRPQAEVYAWTLDCPLPRIPVPLLPGDPDVHLDLQSIFTITYDSAGYDYSLHYDRPVEPPLNEQQQEWVHQHVIAATP